MEANQHWRLVAVGALAPIVWGTTYVVTTELLPPGRPMSAAALRAIPAGLLLLGVTRAWPKQWGRLLLLAFLNIGAFFPLLFIAAYRLPGGLAAVAGAAQPFAVAAATLAFFGAGTPARRMLWAATAVVGVSLAMLSGSVTLDGWGVAAAAAGTLSMALGITLTQRWGTTTGLSGLASTGWQLLLGGLMILPLVPVLDRALWHLTPRAVLGYVWLSLIGGALAYAVWFHAARHLPATSTALLGPLSPVTAALLGWVVLGQSLTPIQGVGFALALAGSVLGQGVGRRPQAVPRSSEPHPVLHPNRESGTSPREEELAQWLLRYEGLRERPLPCHKSKENDVHNDGPAGADR